MLLIIFKALRRLAPLDISDFLIQAFQSWMKTKGSFRLWPQDCGINFTLLLSDPQPPRLLGFKTCFYSLALESVQGQLCLPVLFVFIYCYVLFDWSVFWHFVHIGCK